jgi:hypothetical protein
VPHRVEVMSSRAGQASVVFKVWPAPGVLAVFRPHAVQEVRFDVDLRELQGQDRLDVLCSLLRAIGRRLGKSVLMSPEGFDQRPVLGYQVAVDRVEALPMS